MDTTALFNGGLMLITGVGATIVLVVQAKSSARIAERIAEVKGVADATKSIADKTKEVADATKVVSDQVHVLTNTNYSEQRAIIAKQADQLEAMRRDLAAAQTRHSAELAGLVAQVADMKALVGKVVPAAPPPKVPPAQGGAS